MLEAAAVCIARDGLSALGITAVASEAGVSRPTVYRYFKDRQTLVQAALLHAAGVSIQGMRDRLERLERPADRAIEVVLTAVRQVPDSPVLGELWRAATLDSSALRGFTGPPSIALSREAMRPLVESAGWSESEADEAIEVILRFIVSLLATPEPNRSEPELRVFLVRRLLPALGLVG